MFRTALTRYPRHSSQLMTAICIRGCPSPFRLCISKIEKMQNFSQAQKFAERVQNQAPDRTDRPRVKSQPLHLEIRNPLILCNSVAEVFEYLRRHPKINSYQYVHVFKRILHLYETSNEQSSEGICHTEEFEKLAKDVGSNAHFLNGEDIGMILEVLIRLGISFDSTLCQSLLRSISKRANNLNVKTILLFYKLLRTYPRSPIVDELMTIIPVIFETQVRSRPDTDDIQTLSNALSFAFEHEFVSVEARELLVDTALENVHRFSLKEIIRLVKRLKLTKNNPKNMRDLYLALMTIVYENTDRLNLSNRIMTLPRLVINSYLHIDESLFNLEILENAIQCAIISDTFRANDIGVLLRLLNRISYYCPTLLDYIDEQLQQEKNFQTLPHALLFSYVQTCSDLSYIPENWKKYREKLVTLLEENKGRCSYENANCLISLKCWPKTLIEYCFKDSCWRESSDSEGMESMHYQTMLTLYQTVKLLYSNNYDGPYPSADDVDRITKIRLANREYPLLDSLTVGLGGVQYVLNGVYTKLGQIIHYLIVKCKTGELYPINKAQSADHREVVYESLSLPEDSFPIAIVLLHPGSYCLDGVRMRGRTKTRLRCLVAYGITPIPISYYEWLALEEHEKVAYIVYKIDACVPVSRSRPKSRR